MEFIRKLRFGSQEDLREILKNINFKLIEDINGYKTYYAEDGYKKYQLMEFPFEDETYSFSYNDLIYRPIKKDYVNIEK